LILDFWRKYYRTIFDIGLIFITCYIFMYLFTKLYAIAAPVLISIVIYWIVRKPIKYLTGKGLKHNLAVSIVMIGLLLVSLAIVGGIGALITIEVAHVIDKVPQYSDILQDNLNTTVDTVHNKMQSLPPDTVNKIKNYITNFSTTSLQWLRGILLYIFSTTAGFSGFIFNILTGYILSYFLSIEISSWRKTYDTKAPNTIKHIMHFINSHVIYGIGKYLTAQLKLIAFTALLYLGGLLIIGINNPILISILAAISGILPLVGTGLVIIPIIAYLFLTGYSSLAIGLIILYVVENVLRNIIEPKLVGDSLGVSAFTMFSFMIVALGVFGVVGAIIAPLLIILLKSLYDTGILVKMIRIPHDY
jgi:sporulation integral membrane protein YtvI